MGEGITKKESDLAADVEEQQQALQAKAAEKKDQPAAAAAPEPQQPQQPAIKVWPIVLFPPHTEHAYGGMHCNYMYGPSFMKGLLLSLATIPEAFSPIMNRWVVGARPAFKPV